MKKRLLALALALGLTVSLAACSGGAGTASTPAPETAAPETAAPETAAAGSVTHSVVGGDTLWGIARRYGVELEALLAANPGIKNPNLIYVGQKVVVPC